MLEEGAPHYYMHRSLIGSSRTVIDIVSRSRVEYLIQLIIY